MRAREFITEQNTGALADDVAMALPATSVLPGLLNQDPYKQYRFGLKLAAAGPDQPEYTKPSLETDWGENMVVVAYSNADEKILDLAVSQAKEKKRMISSKKSEETKTVNSTSPVARKKKNKYGV